MKLKEAKAGVVVTTLIVVSLMLVSFKYEEGKKSGNLLFDEKICSLKLNVILAEKGGNREEIEEERELLKDTCKGIANNIFTSGHAKKKALRVLAEVKMKEGDIEGALEVCEKLLREAPEDKASLRVKSIILREGAKELISEGRREEGMEVYKGICDMDITPELNAFNKSVVGIEYMKQKKYDKAIEWFQKIPYENEHNINWKAYSMLFIGMCYELKGEEEEAEKLYRAIIEKLPESQWVENAKENLIKLKSR